MESCIGGVGEIAAVSGGSLGDLRKVRQPRLRKWPWEGFSRCDGAVHGAVESMRREQRLSEGRDDEGAVVGVRVGGVGVRGCSDWYVLLVVASRTGFGSRVWTFVLWCSVFKF